MKGFKLLSVLLLFLCANQSHGQANPLPKQSWSAATIATLHKLTFGVFRKDPALPLEVVTKLSEHSRELQELSNKFNAHPHVKQVGFMVEGLGVRKFDWLPGWYIKHGIDRFENTKKLNRFIKERNLNLISPLEEYLLHIPGRPFKYSSDNYFVIAKEAIGKQPQRLDKAVMDQIKIVEHELPHKDVWRRKYFVDDSSLCNMIVAPNGTVTIIDTDEWAMGKNRPKKKWLGCPPWWHHDIICAI